MRNLRRRYGRALGPKGRARAREAALDGLMPTGFAMMGAMAGSLGGPVGTAIGAAAGGLTGKWGGHSKWKLPAEVYLQSDRDGGVVYNTFRVSADESIAHVRTS